MKIGATVPNAGEVVGALGFVRMAQAAERAGAASIWVSDHLLMVDNDSTDYPYSADGRPSWPRAADYYEALICLATAAGATARIRLGTAILVLPQRNVLEVAKMAATLDQLSGGRFVLGVGAGWSKDEFEALGYTYEDRGARFNEMLQVLRHCWSGRPPRFDGEHVRCPPNVILNPLPVATDGLPVLVGGRSQLAIRRAALYGDGWVAIAFAPEWNADALSEKLATLRRLRVDEGDGRVLYNVLKLHAYDGDWDRLPALVREAQALGFDEVTVDLPWSHGIEAAVETFHTVVEVPSGFDG